MEFGKTPHVKDCFYLYFFVKQKLNLSRIVIIVSVAMTNYKSSMKNIHSFYIGFLTKIEFGVKLGRMPPV